ncbi:thioredoxin [Ancylostoma ceylanicum]|uniref:Thioredoxin n=1 Tax=Ancylostoma ceylanicum TaxID=53326 RepID=A0A0D6LK61_9BILA|nr:thioredoxin [Ancylostoma ceylanicum]
MVLKRQKQYKCLSGSIEHGKQAHEHGYAVKLRGIVSSNFIWNIPGNTEVGSSGSVQKGTHVLHLICPPDYDDKCDDPIMDPYGLFKYRCQTVYPHDDKLSTVDIVNASTLLRMLQHTDPYKRTWCMITLFYSPTCPFSARLAPYFNALPNMYSGSIKFVAFDATEFTKLNSRYGVSGTPTVMLWVSGAAVARMEDRTLNDMGLMSFIYDWTDVTPVFGTARSAEDPLHIEFDDRPDVFYLSLSLFVVYAAFKSPNVACGGSIYRLPMEVTEVEVHRRPQNVDDDENRSGDESPPIGIGSGQVSQRESSVNPLAPKPATPSPQRGSDDNVGGGHVNPVSVDDEEPEEQPRSSAAVTRSQCEIEIEPACNIAFEGRLDSGASLPVASAVCRASPPRFELPYAVQLLMTSSGFTKFSELPFRKGVDSTKTPSDSSAYLTGLGPLMIKA